MNNKKKYMVIVILIVLIASFFIWLKKPFIQIKNDVGLNQYGDIINLDEWNYEITGEGTFRTYGTRGYVNSAGYHGNEKEVSMPAYIKSNDKTYELTEIGELTFSQCKDITSITIPESVTSIYSYAFERMYKFEKHNYSKRSENNTRICVFGKWINKYKCYWL